MLSIKINDYHCWNGSANCCKKQLTCHFIYFTIKKSDQVVVVTSCLSLPATTHIRKEEKNLYATSASSILRKQLKAFVDFEFICVKNNPPEILSVSAWHRNIRDSDKQMWVRLALSNLAPFTSPCSRLLPEPHFYTQTLNWWWMTSVEIKH